MNGSRLFSKSVGRIIGLVTMSLIVMAVTTNSAIAQSTDISNPTRLTSNEISGAFCSDNQGDNYFYSFTAGPGELVVTFSLKGAGSLTTSQYSVAVLDENSKELGSKFITAGSRNSEQQVLRVNVSRKQDVLLRIRLLAVPIGGGTATYRVRISGAVSFNQQNEGVDLSSFMEEKKSGDCLPKQGTLIIRMKDGSKKIIDLSEAETVTVVP
jgi:hypothetical protein